MSENKNTYYRGGVGFFGLLQVLFIALKLIGVINWSWIWVLMPIFGQVALVLIVLVILLVVALFEKQRR